MQTASFRCFINRVVLILAIIFLADGCRQDPSLYKVVGVKDGDTMVLLSPDHQNITVRLAEVDCPEKSQAYGQAAKQFTSDLCFGKEVTLKIVNKDRYGRTVGKVYLPDGTSVNNTIVKEGYAWQYRAYSKDMELAMLEQQARQNRLGLWQDPNPTPPWDFRKAGRKPSATSAKPKRKTRTYRKRRKRAVETVQF